jgi:hypothetical protein
MVLFGGVLDGVPPMDDSSSTRHPLLVGMTVNLLHSSVGIVGQGYIVELHPVGHWLGLTSP